MTDEELDKWWAHLAVEKKEDVIRHNLEEHIEEGVDVDYDWHYPHCTEYWNDCDVFVKRYIYNTAGGRDAHQHHKWKKGNTSFT